MHEIFVISIQNLLFLILVSFRSEKIGRIISFLLFKSTLGIPLLIGKSLEFTEQSLSFSGKVCGELECEECECVDNLKIGSVIAQV